MIEFKQGNILEENAEALVNTVNCVGVMGKGVALQFKQAFPENFLAYKKACTAKEVQPGKMFTFPTGQLFPRYLINFPTKRHWKEKSRLEDIKAGLKALVAEVRQLGIRSIAIPPLGCGNGGLDWAEVKPLIEEALSEIPDVKAIIFEPQGAPVADKMKVATEKPQMTCARALFVRLLELYGIPGYRLSKLEIQKLAYFLQVAGEPLRLRYVRHQYGPYADNLNHVLQKIEGHFIRGYGDRSQNSDIYVLPEGRKEAEAFLATHQDSRERLERVSNLITGFETPYGMEMLATLHWVATEDPQAAVDCERAIERVQEWSDRKRELFKPNHLRKAWQRLHEQNWLSVTDAQTNSEYLYSEKPTIDQLQMMGWQYIEGDWEVPNITERENFKQVLLSQRLREAVKRINLDAEGNPWLDDSQVNSAITTLERITSIPRLMEANQALTDLLLKGTTTEGKDSKNTTLQYIDFEHPENNNFLVINQFRVDPPWSTGHQGFIVPDILLFVNGIPLVVIECKSPKLENPLTEAIADLLKYSNQRNSPQPEGVEKLFYYNLLMVAASQHRAAAGAVGASYGDYVEWKDTAPHAKSDIAQALGVSELNSRQMLIAGMLHPHNLLDILHNFTLFKASGGRTTKLIPRYQQYRAIHEALHRLKDNQTRAQHGADDQRGGIIWHTQGSGKSMTMVYLVRKLRTITELRRFKIVIVTDRTDLEKQLSDTATLAGEPLQRARNVKQLETLLAQPGTGFIFGMIQKFRGGQDSVEEESYEPMARNLNPSEDILVLIDEAHRSHSNTLHANLLEALPNCVRIGFTGTPIVKAAKNSTTKIFGSFIDRYTIRQSQEDGVTVPILYEGLEARGAVAQGDDLDQLFEIVFKDKTPEERAEIKKKYATKSEVSEAQELIRAKAQDMLRHYLKHILPNGFKAQVVATSRLAAVRYYEALTDAKNILVQQLESRAALLRSLDMDALAALDSETQFLGWAYPYLDSIRRLEFAAIISEDKDDAPTWSEWTNKGKQEAYIERFKKPLEQDGLAFLVVKNMLLTGFDAPVEQVMYLDRGMKDYELLQAIARVNRTHQKKDYGLVVDYYGVNIPAALAVYDEVDLEAAWFDIREELPKLRERHQRTLAVFTERGCKVDDVDTCVDLLRDEKLRVQFTECFKDFLETLDLVLPRPEAIPYVQDAKQLGLIRKSVADLYRDEKLNLVDAREKVRALIDQYIQSQGIDPKVEPIDVLSLDFKAHVQRHRSTKAQAAEMEYAARHHISVQIEEDPVYYQKLSERLDQILQTFADNWEAQVEALRQYIEDIQKGRPGDQTGLEPKTQLPFLSLIAEESERDLSELAQATVEIVDRIRTVIRRVRFWENLVAQEELKNWIVQYLDDNDVVPFDRQESVADKLVQLARHKHETLMT